MWVIFGINSLWEKLKIFLHRIKKEKSQQQHIITGAIECTVNGRYINLTAIYYEKILHVTFTILDICRSVQQVFFPTSASQHPCRFERTRSHTLTSFPSIYSLHCGPTSWPSLSRCDVCRLVDDGSSSVSDCCLSWKIGCCFLPEHILYFPSSC